jgi:hypothetical protein
VSFVCPLPPVKVLVRPEYLYDFSRDCDTSMFVEGIWCSVKAIKGEAFRFETYLPEYGALYDKLPISAFYTPNWGELEEDVAQYTDLPLDVLQIWDALSYHVTVVDKPLLKGLRAQFFAKDKKVYQGEYMFTIDTCSPDPRIPDFGFSESVDEHKSYNVLKLDHGQFALQPNNRCQFFDPAFNPQVMKQPDFKVATKKYRVEQHAKWRLGDTDNFTYESKT